MKYKIGDKIVKASYGDYSNKNPLIDALPEVLPVSAFNKMISSFPIKPVGTENMSFQQRKQGVSNVQQIFVPLNYMYFVYDQLTHMILSTYNTRTSKENIIRINSIVAGKELSKTYGIQPQSVSLLGTPGLGKTSTIKRCLSLMPQVIEHEKYLGEPFFCKQILYLFCECPSDASIRTMCYNIVRAIDNTIGGNHVEHLMHVRVTATSSAMTYIKVLCLTYNIGLICIDEIQNLVIEATKNKRLKPLIRFLTELTNDTATAVYMSGTHAAEAAFVKEEYLKRRTRGLRLLPFKNDAVYRNFISQLWPYQYTEAKCKLIDSVANVLYDCSGGIPAYIAKIFEESQSQALLLGKSSIDEKLVRYTAEFLAIRPQKISISGNFISDFSLHVAGDNASQTPFEINILNDAEEAPEKRLYANARGRKVEQRDEIDLVAALPSGSLISMLYDHKLIEEV